MVTLQGALAMDPVIFFELPAEDLDRAKRFYEKVFGWEIDSSYARYFWAHTTPVRGKSHRSAVAGQVNGALQQKDDAIRMPRIVVQVASIDDVVEKIAAGGGSVMLPKRGIPGTSVAYAIVRDTEGNEINIIENLP
jgi:predicted enzyme related to lactoylglutathione lyase